MQVRNLDPDASVRLLWWRLTQPCTGNDDTREDDAMAPRTYALLVGINDYPAEVGRLAGCLNDVDAFRAWLEADVDPACLAVEVLKDSEATRDNIIRLFRSHLGKAQAGDVALFQYCGHGARWASAAAFREFAPDGRDEGLVCIDSRRPGGFDLADKELAVLIAEVAARDPHVAVLLDCCHSGSGTRSADAFRGLVPRLTHEVTSERPLESYLDGYYAQQASAQRRDGRVPLHVPTGRHVLLSACERTQLAQESSDRRGVFTSTLLEVLEKSGGNLSYADLFVRCRAAVRRRATNQDPQFEAIGQFDASSGFLGRAVSRTRGRYSAYFDQGGWTVECGAIHGVPTAPERPVTLQLFPEDDPAHVAGTATAVQVGAQRSTLQLAFAADPAVRYRAEITSMPVPPLLVCFRGDAAAREACAQALSAQGCTDVLLTDIEAGAGHVLAIDAGTLWLEQAGTARRIQGARIADGGLAEAAADLVPALAHVVQWERSRALRNDATRIAPAQVDFLFSEALADGGEHVHTSGEVTLDYVKAGGEWVAIRGRLQACNRTKQTLHVALAYFDSNYGITILRNEPIEPGGVPMTLWGDAPENDLYVPEGENEAVDHFKLIVSTERVDDFLLAQDPIEVGSIVAGTRAIGSRGPVAKRLVNEWCTRDCVIRTVRRLDEVGQREVQLAGGRIVVAAHPAFKASLSIGAAAAQGRSVGGGIDFHAALAQGGMTLLNFAGTRGNSENVLELTGIQDAAALRAQPLELTLKVPLQQDEGILPVVFDGQHVLLGGAPYTDADGNTRVSIDWIPEVADNRRSLGSALKLYFFKTWLAQPNVNRLRWVEYRADGSIAQREDGVAAKVAGARNVLLLVHGIIGDTEGMAAGVQACGLDARFDLVLTYDYENLATPIEETARTLGLQLAAAGLGAQDDKRLTLLVHSMGGLVSRWFIEREGGRAMVDHLVMCGTPNGGSPFGQVEAARKVLTVLTSLSMNYLPAFVPFSGAVLMLLNRSRKLTPTLEQMHPASTFITTLNASDDPGIPYTILAGDVDAWREPSDALSAQMLAKVGRGVLFDVLFSGQANDIAVGVPSIVGVGGQRAVAPVRTDVACHHLNYFTSDAGRQALQAVAW